MKTSSDIDSIDTFNDIAQQGAQFSLISIVLTGLFYCIATLI